MIEWYMIILELIGYIALVFSISSLIWLSFGYTIFIIYRKKLKIKIVFLCINILLFITVLIFIIIWVIVLRAPELLNGFDNSNEISKILLIKITITNSIISIIAFIFTFFFSKYFGYIELNNKRYSFGKLILIKKENNIKKV